MRSKDVVVSDYYYYYKRKQLLQPSIIAKQERLIVLHVGQFLLPLSLAFWATKRSNNRSAVAIRATERSSLRLHLYSEIDQGWSHGRHLTEHETQRFGRNTVVIKEPIRRRHISFSLNTNRRFARSVTFLKP